MKTTWLNHHDNSHCILFFNGWGMTEDAVKYLDCGVCDVCICSDYEVFPKAFTLDLTPYDKVYLVAWSLGVWVASVYLSKYAISFEKSIAINGTGNPIDAKEGISPNIFQATIIHWDDVNRVKFNSRMMGGTKVYKQYKERLGNRQSQNQRLELQSLYTGIQEKPILDYIFDTAIIGQRDAIFLPDNQLRFWQNKATCITIDTPHYPFHLFESWTEILDI